MPSTALPVSVTAIHLLDALEAVDVPAFFDSEEWVIYAHPKTVTQAEALNHTHIMIDWQESPDHSLIRAIAERPDGPSDFQVIGTVYETPVRRSRAEEASVCARAAAEWLHAPGKTAGSVLLNALADYGIAPGDGLAVTYGPHSDTYDVFLPLPDGERARLSVADRNGSLKHVPAAHTGWSVVLHDERGELVGEPVVWASGDGSPLDCAEDSAAVAAFLADVVTAPISRHCDCYNNEHPGRPHDRACNRYTLPNTAQGKA
ncbi:hypothetical protein ABZ905_32255 [Streptomyces parvus]|uniref:hypothetical protein n=1 Tax=Streptomyces parvus TaxID=66428 RepID=UPI0033FA07CD